MIFLKLTVTCIFFVALAKVAYANQDYNDSVTYTELSISKEEAVCRYELDNFDIYLVWEVIAIIGVLSVLHLMISVCVVVYVHKHALKEANNFLYNTHKIMDTVSANMIPDVIFNKFNHQSKPKGTDG